MATSMTRFVISTFVAFLLCAQAFARERAAATGSRTQVVISAFKWINGVLAGIGVVIPAFSFFTLFAPPFF